jgi:hypothetical protein
MNKKSVLNFLDVFLKLVVAIIILGSVASWFFLILFF